MSPKLRTRVSAGSAVTVPPWSKGTPAGISNAPSPPPQVPWGRMGTEVGSFTDRLRQSASRSPGTGTPSARPGAGKGAAAAGQPWRAARGPRAPRSPAHSALSQVLRATPPLYTVPRLCRRPASSRGRARSEDRPGSRWGGGRPGAPLGFPGGWQGGSKSARGPLRAGPGRQRLLGAKGSEAARASPPPPPDHLGCSSHALSLAAAITTASIMTIRLRSI